MNLPRLTKNKHISINCLTPSESACNLSHIKALELIAASEDEYGVIFEDDAPISLEAYDFLKSSNWIPKDISFIKLDKGFTKTYIKIKNLNKSKLPQNRYLGDIIINPFGASAYIVSKNIAKYLANELRKTTLLVDVFYFDSHYGNAKYIKAVQLQPAIVDINRNIKTEIIHSEKIYNKKMNRLAYYKYCLRYKLKKIMLLIKYWSDTKNKYQIISFR